MDGKHDEYKEVKTTVKQSMVSDEFRKSLLLEDVIIQRPEYEIYVTLALSKHSKTIIKEIEGKYSEIIGIKAFMVPQKQKKKASGKFNFADFNGNIDY